jgi:hypothetical protein
VQYCFFNVVTGGFLRVRWRSKSLAERDLKDLQEEPDAGEFFLHCVVVEVEACR